MQHAKDLIAAGTKVIDLAADFRLQNLEQFEKWYGMEHACPDVLKDSVYGLTELNREKLSKLKSLVIRVVTQQLFNWAWLHF